MRLINSDLVSQSLNYRTGFKKQFLDEMSVVHHRLQQNNSNLKQKINTADKVAKQKECGGFLIKRLGGNRAAGHAGSITEKKLVLRSYFCVSIEKGEVKNDRTEYYH